MDDEVVILSRTLPTTAHGVRLMFPMINRLHSHESCPYSRLVVDNIGVNAVSRASIPKGQVSFEQTISLPPSVLQRVFFARK